MKREPSLDDLIGTDTTPAERERLQRVHELILQTGPPPELSPELEAGPTLAMTMRKRRRAAAKPRAMLLLAAALTVALVFLGGYAVGNGRGKRTQRAVITQALKGTSIVPQAQGSLEVWRSHDGKNWPMTLSVVGLPKLPPHNYYEVYLLRHGKPWGSCGTFRVGASPRAATTVTLTAPYSLRKGDSWVVTRPGAGGVEPGKTVLRPAPVSA